ncbi:acyltransferase [Asticcacaulis sp. EMRT-3]|uniref:acyltransferase family protein n=1 Tax=Asticcacaulis sp. EMRT-3 TaxID=3040349 RepID=UPI0024AEEA91|nr:acyltransferase [Asticcacaulis sp. EMRT-3]MDI7774777.1 acyltransferase [Asticcacaulis sp. EMRT-3]
MTPNTTNDNEVAISRPQDLRPLTSLRFFAAMWVVAYHFWPDLQPVRPDFVAKGYLGVDLFFVLSGFILSHVYLENFRAKRFGYRDFLWARLARIYPMHITIIAGLGVLIGGLALVGVHAGDKLIIWSSLPAHLTLTQAWGLAPHGGWNHPSWSISAEWFAYITFPAFATAAVALWARPFVAVGLAVLLLAALYLVFPMLAGFQLTEATIFWGALRIVPCFALGCAMWLVWRSGRIRSAPTALMLAAAGMIGLVANILLHAPDLITVLFCATLILGLGLAARAGSSILSQAWLVYLGEVSFAIYMICIPWQLVYVEGLQRVTNINPDAMPIWLWAGLVAGVIPAAIVLHHLIELPARHYMRMLQFTKNRPLSPPHTPID